MVVVATDLTDGVDVRAKTSTVLLLTDEGASVAAYLSSGTLEGLVQGQDGPRVRMNYLNAEVQLSTGDAVYWVVRNGLLPMTPAGHDFSMVIERDYDKTALLPTVDLTESVWDLKRSGRTDWWKPFMAMSNEPRDREAPEQQVDRDVEVEERLCDRVMREQLARDRDDSGRHRHREVSGVHRGEP